MACKQQLYTTCFERAIFTTLSKIYTETFLRKQSTIFNCKLSLKKVLSYMLDSILNAPLEAFKHFPLNSVAMFTRWFYVEATNH